MINYKMVNGAVIAMTAEEITQLDADRAASAAQLPSQYAAQVDADVDAIYRDAIGNRGPEYEAAKRDALAFIASDYNPPPPEFVRSYADAAGLDYTTAANNIIAQSDAWQHAMEVIRANRLAAKAGARGANPEAAMAQWQAFVTGIRQQLGI